MINNFRMFLHRVGIAFKFGWAAFKYPQLLQVGNLKMMAKMFEMILQVAIDGRHRMTHIAYVHPDEGEKEIVSIWAGAGVGAEPTKRIAELLEENAKLKAELAKQVCTHEN